VGWWRGRATNDERRIEIDLSRCNGLLRFDVSNEHLRREISHFELGNPDRRERNHEVLAELDVVESYDRHFFGASNPELGQSLAQSHRDEVVIAGDGGGTVAFGARLKERVAAAIAVFEMCSGLYDVVGAEHEVAAAVRAMHSGHALLAVG
jgi:hypothetical protein